MVLGLSTTQRDALRQAQENLCALCGKPMHRNQAAKGERTPPEIETEEHVFPKSASGADDFGNIVLAHFSCNFEKGDRPPTEPEVAKLREVMARIDRQVLLDSVRVRIPHLSNRFGGHRSAAQRALSTLAPFLDTDLLLEAMGANPKAHRQRLTAKKQVSLATPATPRPVQLVAKQAHTSKARPAKSARKRRASNFPLLAFIVAALAVSSWIVTFVLTSANEDALGSVEARLIGATHLALVFGAFNRVATPLLSKLVTWCFLLGGVALLLPSPVELVALWNLPVPETSISIATQAVFWAAPLLLILGWTASVLTQITRRADKSANAKEAPPADRPVAATARTAEALHT